jgi:hypothetical protein
MRSRRQGRLDDALVAAADEPTDEGAEAGEAGAAGGRGGAAGAAGGRGGAAGAAARQARGSVAEGRARARCPPRSPSSARALD